MSVFDAQSAIQTADMLAQRAAALGKMPSGVLTVLRTVRQNEASGNWSDEDSQSILARESRVYSTPVQ